MTEKLTGASDLREISRKLRNKYECMQDFFGLVLTQKPTIEQIVNYMADEDCHELQEFCINNLRPEIQWSTGIGIIEAAEEIYKEALMNANFDYFSREV